MIKIGQIGSRIMSDENLVVRTSAENRLVEGEGVNLGVEKEIEG